MKKLLARLFLGTRIALSFLLPFLALGSIGAGVWLIYPPAALITVGALVLIDLYRKDPTP